MFHYFLFITSKDFIYLSQTQRKIVFFLKALIKIYLRISTCNIISDNASFDSKHQKCDNKSLVKGPDQFCHAVCLLPIG